ncbi:MAG: cytochrome C oxidase subunit IV family protein [Chloroflexi bacterium]|nr:cytochrome C oxidase subunit IV family protein [Chloroflexota bacterium]
MSEQSHAPEMAEAAEAAAHGEHAAHAEHAETTVVFGRELPFPLYTVVFLGLGILTIIEVLVAEVFSSGIKIPILLALAAVKAYLVVYYYMHLKTDSRLFAVALIVPLVVALVSMLFVLITPPGSY